MHCPFSRIHECMHTSTRVRQAPMVSSKHAASVFYSPIFVFPLKSILYNYELNKQRIICSLMHFHTRSCSLLASHAHAASQTTDNAREQLDKKRRRNSYSVASEMNRNRKKNTQTREREREMLAGDISCCARVCECLQFAQTEQATMSAPHAIHPKTKCSIEFRSANGYIVWVARNNSIRANLMPNRVNVSMKCARTPSTPNATPHSHMDGCCMWNCYSFAYVSTHAIDIKANERSKYTRDARMPTETRIAARPQGDAY